MVVHSNKNGMAAAISTGDCGSRLTKNEPCGESESILVSAVSVDISSLECQGSPESTHSVLVKVNNDETHSSCNKWKEFSFMDMYDYFDCRAHARNKLKPLYTPDMWTLMREVFAAQAGIHLSLLEIYDNGIDYYSDYAEGKGRGAFAARDFSKGDLVHDGSLNTVFWNDGLQWKKFIVSLPPPMSCDVLEWTWIQQVGDQGWRLCLNLNDAAFMNHNKVFNIAPIHNTSLEFYAVRGK